jgi:dimethylaniline monooxygenase (N-oxide forming)
MHRSEEFRGRRVVVLGLGNTGGDVADALVGIASSVTLSHNRGAVIVSLHFQKWSPVTGTDIDASSYLVS